MWLGWHRGEVGELAELARLMPRLVRFVSEFGAQSVPDRGGEFVDASSWPQIDWEALREHHGLEVEVMAQRVPPDEHPTFDAWRMATQRNQASILRHHIETLRRLKYRPTGGFCFSWLADPAPMISASVLDDRRSPKLAWQAVVDACRPVVVVIDPLPPLLRPGDELALDVHVVNDLRSAVVDATVAVTCTWRGGKRQWKFRGDVDADAVALVGRLELTVPDAPGDLLLGLALTGRDADDRDVTATRRAAPHHAALSRRQVTAAAAAVGHPADAQPSVDRQGERSAGSGRARAQLACETSSARRPDRRAVITSGRASCGSSAWP